MRLIRQRLARGKDDGLTLVELVVTVAILGIVAVVLLGVVIEYLKVTGSTRARLGESTDQQFISTYWQNDVSSLGRRDFNPGNADPVPTVPSVSVGTAGPGGCGASVGPVVVAFAWVEYPVGASVPANAWNPTSQEVAYVRAGSAAPFVLQRVRCKGGVEGAPLTVAHNLTRTPTVTCDTSCSGSTLPNRVSMEFTVRDASEAASVGYTTTVSADRRQG
ncbi:type II secretion system protein [Nocardioides daeguensis]|uniref:Prepilin-type N-terminal cleavage/methylation domain-containing protein n=1 Tax=Nocardioides daeguensis TaxID=908359 RepID=A0ABP6UXQ6_9ACTN|nr:prepilin-type N-terminal cleavage/methylation domain-containing protein [Nocardioides daeguensis]MBV6725967.1 type II secretion system GspH family protein [Nocardioides daeguensis]MCR1772517.1 type II secretion system GspH family protein [Nocardioides daeguensis]